MADPHLTVLIPIRNRAGQRLDNCLRSLRWQSLPSAEFEILISDFGSTRESRTDIEKAAARHGARVLHATTDAPWNRSRALNLGIQEARGENVLCTDCDMIFAPNFLVTVLAALKEHRGRALVVSRCWDLPSDVPEGPHEVEDFPALLARATLRPSHGTGACQATLRRWFEEVRGYDEKYVYWGFEDKDLLRRAKRSGLTLAWIHEQTSMLHQWHISQNDRPLRKALNHWRFRLTGWGVRRNRGGWGSRV